MVAQGSTNALSGEPGAVQDSELAMKTIFYAWASDHENSTSRGFIRKAVDQALSRGLHCFAATWMWCMLARMGDIGLPAS